MHTWNSTMISRWPPRAGLHQPQIADNKNHYYNNANDIKNTHMTFSLLSRDRIYLSRRASLRAL